MKKTLLSLSLLFFCLFGQLAAQDLHIHYDAETAQVKYIYNDEEIKRPKIKKNGNIFLHVENYNNYLYSLDVKANNQLLQIPSGNAVGGLFNFPGGDSGMGGGFGGGNFNSGASDGYITIESSGGLPFAAATEEGVAEFQRLNARYENILGKMVKKEMVFTLIEEQVKSIAEVREFRSIGLSEIKRIKWNPNFSPAQVKKMSYEFLNKMLKIDKEQPLTLDYVIQQGDDREALLDYLSKLEKNKREYERNVNELGLFSEELSSINLGLEEFDSLENNVYKVFTNAQGVKESVESQKKSISQMAESSGKRELQKMTSIWYEYEALAANDFSYTYRTEAAGDRVTLGIEFTAKDSFGNIIPITKKELIPIKVPVYGGMKINVSVGLSFGQFFEQPQSYFLQDTIIGSEDGDSFVPVITSFFHFYPQSAGNVSIGGNFGVGIPLANSENGQSLSFFVGPSLIIGRSQRVVLSTGVMGGKTQRLSQGLEVGDELLPFSVVPTKSAYQLGYFLGVSFNLGGI